MSLIDRVLPHRRRILRAQFLKTLLQDVTDESQKNAHSEFRSSIDELGLQLADISSSIHAAEDRLQADLDSRFSALKQDVLAELNRGFSAQKQELLAIFGQHLERSAHLESELGRAQARLEQFAGGLAARSDEFSALTDRVFRIKGDISAQFSFFARDLELLVSTALNQRFAPPSTDSTERQSEHQAQIP